MSARDPDLRIDAWLRNELDAVPEPTRAVQRAVDAAAVTLQHRSRLARLRQLLGLDHPITEHGRRDRPEVVLTPRASSDDGGVTVLRREGSMLLPAAFAIMLVAVVAGAAAWLTLGPAGDLLGGSATEGTVAPEQPLRPLEPPGPDRVIVVDPMDGHFSTIAGAVAAAEPGDRIELRPGTYPADVVVDKDVTIVGVGARDTVVVVPQPLPAGEPERLRTLFTLVDSDATLQGITVRGSDYGTAIRIHGGSPTLADLYVDPDGEMRTSGPNRPREALEITDGASPIIRDLVATSLSSVLGGSSATFDGGRMQSGCLLIEDEGTSAVVRGVTFAASECPGFSISVSKGARVLVEASPIDSLVQNAGIRVANEGSSAEVSGTSITGGSEGLFVGDGAEATFIRSNVTSAGTGIRVNDATLDLQHGAIIGNDVGLSVAGDSYLATNETDVCQNGQNLDLADGARVPLELNRICQDGTAELAVEPGG